MNLRGHGLLSGTSPDPPQETYFASYALQMARFYTTVSPEFANLSLLSQLPIPFDLDRLQMQRLFYSCKQDSIAEPHFQTASKLLAGGHALANKSSIGFVLQAPRHFTVPKPEQVKSDLLHSPFLAPAFADSVLCLSILTVSAASQTQTPNQSTNVLALTLFDRAMVKLRESVQKTRDSVADTTIAAATYLWAANFYLTDDESLQQHASSVRALVDARDGLENLGMSGAVANLFKWVDVINSLRLNRPCQLPDQRALQSPLSAGRSGGAWNSDAGHQMLSSDREVVRACQDCCRAIDVLDEAGAEEMNAVAYFYLYERSAQLYQEASIPRARYSGTGSLEECIILAIDVLKLIVFNGGQTQTGRRVLRLQAKYLSVSVRAAGGANFWQRRIHLFIWIMFLTYVSKPVGAQEKWCSHVLRGALEHVFGPRAGWSDQTITELQSMLFTFGWRNVTPLDDLASQCDSLWR